MLMFSACIMQRSFLNLAQEISKMFGAELSFPLDEAL